MKNNRKNNNEFENTAGIITLEHYNILRQECNDMKERLAVLRKNKRGEQVIDTSAISQAEVGYNWSLSLEETSQHEIDFLENFLSRVKVVTEEELSNLRRAHVMTLGSHALIDYDGEDLEIYLTNSNNGGKEDEYGFTSVTITSPVGKGLDKQKEGYSFNMNDNFGDEVVITIKKIYSEEELEKISSVKRERK